MTLGKRVILGVALLAILCVCFVFFMRYQDRLETENEFMALVAEGFDKLASDPDSAAADQAVQLGIQAMQMQPERKESCLLLGRAYLAKKMFNQGIEVLQNGLAEFEDLKFYPELNFYLGKGYSLLYGEVQQDEIWNKALNGFTEALSSPYHRSGAYFGIGILYLAKLKENPSPFLKEKAALNFQRCIEIEEGMEGFLPDEPDSICPLCRAEFKKKADNESFSLLMNSLNKSN